MPRFKVFVSFHVISMNIACCFTYIVECFHQIVIKEDVSLDY